MKKGALIKFVDYGGILALVPLPEDPIAAMRGMLKGPHSLTGDLMAARQEDAAREDS